MNEEFKLVPIEDSSIVQIERPEISEISVSLIHISIELNNDDDVNYLLMEKNELVFLGIYSTSDSEKIKCAVKLDTKNLPKNVWIYKSNVWVNTAHHCYNCDSRVRLSKDKSLCLDNKCGKYTILADNISIDDMIELMIKSKFKYVPCIMCSYTIGNIIDDDSRIDGKPYIQTIGEMVDAACWTMSGVLKDANGEFVELYNDYYEGCEWREFTEDENDKIANAIVNELKNSSGSFLSIKDIKISSIKNNKRGYMSIRKTMEELGSTSIERDNFILVEYMDEYTNELSYVFSFMNNEGNFVTLFNDGIDPLPWVKKLFFKMKELEEKGEI